MKQKFILTTLLAAFLAVGPASIQADDWGKTPEEKQKHLSEKMDKMTKDLNLTSEQQATVRSVLQDKIDRMQAIQTETEQRIKAVLNTEQTRKYDEMMMKKKK